MRCKKERMKSSNLFLLSGKYEVLRTLGSGSFSTVYLARHQSLEVERAIKVIPKESSDQLSVLSEARLLKSMKHPGIPMIYDIEEDQDNYYLVEEYIKGESLEEYLLHQPFISLNFFCTCCMQLCDIFIYLHSFLPYPVLYQDLKPAHIIVCGNQIKLIDFGISCSITSLGNNFKQFGNAAFSAPEHLLGKSESVTADIFSIGKLMEYLKGYVDTRLSRSFQHIIQKATDPDPDLRFETVEDLSLEIQKQFYKISQPHLCKKIAVVGSFPGCGATHIAISLVSALNYLGKGALYYEENPDNNLRNLLAVSRNMCQKDGYVYYRFFGGFPKYGPGVRIEDTFDGIKILDFGTELSAALSSDADTILYICSGGPWHYPDSCARKESLILHKDRVKVICNLGNSRIAHQFAKEFSLPVYMFSYEKDPFSITPRKLELVEQLLSQKGRFLSFFALRRRFPHSHKQ